MFTVVGMTSMQHIRLFHFTEYSHKCINRLFDQRSNCIPGFHCIRIYGSEPYSISVNPRNDSYEFNFHDLACFARLEKRAQGFS